MVSVGLGVVLMTNMKPDLGQSWQPWAILGGTIGVALCIIVVDMLIRVKRVDTISGVYFGLIVGLFMAYVANLALTPVFPDEPDKVTAAIKGGIQMILAVVFCYICISVLLQTKNDFRFIIPYVEFAKDVKGRKPLVLDTSVVIDGRIADVVEARIFDGALIMPNFVIAELQAIADSSDRLRRSRGRRGLDILNRLRTNPAVDLRVHERDLPEFAGQPVDMKLVILAQNLGGKLVTNDYNLNKIAQLHGIEVINLNELANALKPIFLPGERIEVRIVKAGEEPGQGVGYLEDGTMVVIEGGREHVGKEVTSVVTSVLQTSAGRMVFGKVA